MRSNISKTEARAITELKSINSIIIKPADKGGAVVVMDKTYTSKKAYASSSTLDITWKLKNQSVRIR